MMKSATKYEHSINEPLNREPDAEHLISSFITKTDGFDRNHGSPIPVIDGSAHRIKIGGDVLKQLDLSLEDLKLMTQHTILGVLQCAGNRRHAMRTLVGEVRGIDWNNGAVMNCEWRGPRLRDVLLRAGINNEKQVGSGAHVEFSCHQNPSPEEEWYGASVPLERALSIDAEIVVALEMNGVTLTSAHGYPARIIAPGLAGVRSVKWLDKITVQQKESSNHYQQRDYKVLPPNVDTPERAEKEWSLVPALQEMPINSSILSPCSDSTTSRDQHDKAVIRGYAIPGYGSGPITNVAVSADDGESWSDADLYVGLDKSIDQSRLKWAWCLWQIKMPLREGSGRRFLSRATDKGGNAQREARSEWNLRGVAYNGYGEVNNVNVT